MGLKKKAIVVYLDNDFRIDIEFSWLWKTWQLYSLEEEYDLVVYHPKEAKERVSKYYGIIPIEMENIRMSDEYPFLNSHYFCLPEWSEPLKQYDYILKTDCDVFLTEHMKGYTPTKILVGQGGYYKGEEHVKVEYIKTLSEKMGYVYKNMTLIGASIFGNAKSVIKLVEQQALITEEILKNYSNTKEFNDVGFDKGISSMIAGEIVVNHYLSNQYVNLYSIDSKPWDIIDMGNDILHIHAWHTDLEWSKHNYFKGMYGEWEVSINDAFKNAANYCQFISTLKMKDLNKYKDLFSKGELEIKYSF